MDKKELTKSMAEFIGLSISLNQSVFSNNVWHEDFEKYFSSPEGFFAVWDKVDKNNHKSAFMLGFWMDVMGRIYMQKQDRYTAMYSAIKELMDAKD